MRLFDFFLDIKFMCSSEVTFHNMVEKIASQAELPHPLLTGVFEKMGYGITGTGYGRNGLW